MRNQDFQVNGAVLVVGTGKSGISASRLLLSKGVPVILFDEKDRDDKDQVRQNFPQDAEIELAFVELGEDRLKGISAAVLSPGVPTDGRLAELLKEKGIPLYGEVELAWQFSRGDVLAVTGTNGKTTTTALLGEILKHFAESAGEALSERKVFVVGNIGFPYTDIVDETEENSLIAAELSSFQLETIKRFHPRVSAILNLTPDHLDRHHSMENYALAKERIAENQGPEDAVVLNYDDELTRSFAEETTVPVVFFTRDPDVDAIRQKFPDREFVYLKGDDIYYNETHVINVRDLHLLGSHNYENVMAAVGMTARYGVPMEVIREAVREFRAVEHRIEFVRSVDGVDYYNDSKGTNPDAAIKAVMAMNRKTLLIGGGFDKKLPFDDWVKCFEGRVELLVLIGQTADAIAECADKYGFHSYVKAESLEDAVRICHENALSGQAVLLSPACASWGVFKNYEERGRLFKEYVNSLPSNSGEQ